MSGMNSKNCCKGCVGDTEICCLKGTFVGGFFDGRELFFVKRSYGAGAGSTPSVWEFGEDCSETDGSGKCNNMNGHLRTGWNTSTEYEEIDPFRAFLGCMPDIHIKWMPDTAECKVKMFVGGNAPGGRLFIAQGSSCEAHLGEWPFDDVTGRLWTLGYSAYNLDSDWYTGTVTLTDWRYMQQHDLHPDDYPLPAPTFTIEPCPVRDNFDPVDNGSIRIAYNWQYRDLDDETGEPVGDWLDSGDCGVMAGDCVCDYLSDTDNTTIYRYFFDGYTRISKHFTNCVFCLENLLNCDWYDSLPTELECPNKYHYYDPEVIGEPFLRVQLTKLEESDPPPGCDPEGEPPTGEEEYCFKQSLCVQMAFNLDVETGGYESAVQCNMLWDGDLDRYFLEYCNSSENDCSASISITEVAPLDTCPEGEGYREWEVVLLITAISTGFTLYEETFRVCLKCGSQWYILKHIELEDTTTIDLRIGTTCTTPPEPPECDPGCWPECVMCPERKTLYVVVSDAPDCCLSGTYALTWVGTGGGGAPTVGYYELPAAVGGPINTCGQITFLRVSCVDASHIMVQLVYLRAEGTEISHLSPPYTLSVICDESGNLESEPIHVPGRSGDRESLCGFGSGVGGDIRIVSI